MKDVYCPWCLTGTRRKSPQNTVHQVVAKDFTCPVCEASAPAPVFSSAARDECHKTQIIGKDFIQAMFAVALLRNEAGRAGSEGEHAGSEDVRTGSDAGTDPEQDRVTTATATPADEDDDSDTTRGCCKTWLLVLHLLNAPICTLYIFFLFCFTFLWTLVLGFVMVFVLIRRESCGTDTEGEEEAKNPEDKVLEGFFKVLEKVMMCCLFSWYFRCCQVTYELVAAAMAVVGMVLGLVVLFVVIIALLPVVFVLALPVVLVTKCAASCRKSDA